LQKTNIMRLPIIKHVVGFIEHHDEDWVTESIELLESMADAKGVKDEELEVIGELISNFYGALEVQKAIKEGKSQKDALNEFMKRVTGSIEPS
jgi:predicted metal-dependent hydrolase